MFRSNSFYNSLYIKIPRYSVTVAIYQVLVSRPHPSTTHFLFCYVLLLFPGKPETRLSPMFTILICLLAIVVNWTSPNGFCRNLTRFINLLLLMFHHLNLSWSDQFSNETFFLEKGPWGHYFWIIMSFRTFEYIQKLITSTPYGSIVVFWIENLKKKPFMCRQMFCMYCRTLCLCSCMPQSQYWTLCIMYILSTFYGWTNIHAWICSMFYCNTMQENSKNIMTIWHSHDKSQYVHSHAHATHFQKI